MRIETLKGCSDGAVGSEKPYEVSTEGIIMYLHQVDGPPEHGPGGAGTLPYREALAETERKQREEYLRDCKGVQVLETLEREYISPGDRVRRLEKQLELLPRIVEFYQKLGALKTKVLTKTISKDVFLVEVEKLIDAFPEIIDFHFPSGYGVGSLASETEKLRCQLSRARWEFMVWNRTKKLPGRLLPVR